MTSSAPLPIIPVAPPPQIFTPFSNWTVTPQKQFKRLLAPGKYYVGNLFNAIPHSVYYELFGNAGYKSGIYVEKQTHHFFFVYCSKGGGDGSKYPVAPQVFGVCPAFQVRTTKDIQEFKDYFHCRLFEDRFFFTQGVRPVIIMDVDSD